MTTRIRLAVFSAALGVGCTSNPTGDSVDLSAVGGEAAQQGKADSYGTSGHTLIADQFNNRIIELDSHARIVWSFGDGSSTPGPTSIVAPNDAERIGSYTLIAGTGAPAGTEPTCTTDCTDSRVVLVNKHGRIVWQYGQDGSAGAGDDQLSAPVCAVFLPNAHVLITDQGNQRVIEVDGRKHIVWQYGTTGQTGTDEGFLNNPNSAELLENGNVLIADENNNRVLEVSRDKHVVWSYGDATKLNGAAFASRIEATGNTLISDSNNNRIVEVDGDGNVVWSFVTNTRTGANAMAQPTRGIRLRDGRTLISDQFDHQVLAVDASGTIGFTYGQLNVAGNGPGQLNAPYDAKIIGDFTGITPPFGWY